ncbi:MAG: agmatinase [Balneolaceae bacterium]|nr:MAG: agmatinase [Balneolaceae bacterium]
MIQLLGIPYDKNSSYLRGPALAPPRIRQMATDGSTNLFSEYGLEIKENKMYHDLGDMTFEKTDPESAFLQIRNKISGILTNPGRLLSLGGDHSISYPVIDAHADVFENLNILQFDAHSDLYDSFDNNPYSHASPFARLMETGKIQSLTQVGVRALTDHQREQAKKFDVQIVEMNDFSTDFLKGLKGPLYISLDMDVLDPAYAPGVSHHEPGGLPTRELIRLLQQIAVPIAGADIVEYNPTRDVNNMTAMVGYKLFKEMVYLMHQHS